MVRPLMLPTVPLVAAMSVLFATSGLPANAADQFVLDEVVRIVSSEFYTQDGRQRFADAIQERVGELQISNEYQNDYSNIIDEALSELNVSHTGRYTPDRIDYYELMDVYGPAGIADRLDEVFAPDGVVTYAGIGVIPRTIDGRQFVAYVYHGSPAADADILVGDEILAIDGQPYEPIGSFADRVSEQVTVTLRRTVDGASMERGVRVALLQPGDTFINAIRASARIIEHNGSDIGYVRLWTFARSDVQALVTELLTTGALAEADGLVLDLRGRWGGAPADAGELFVGRTPLVTFVGPDGETGFVNYRWRKPIVALIDEGTRSGMELLAYSLQSAGIPLIGARSAGALVGGRPFVLSDGSLLLVAVVDARVDGRVLEGIGLQPDIPVDRHLPYAAGRDDQLARAIDELSRLL